MKIWVKMSSENRRQGAWFFDLEYAKQCARSWERVIPVELPEWMDDAMPDDGDHSKNGELADQLVTDIMDKCYRKGFQDGAKSERINV